jgi:xanthosine phosphorylase
MSQSHKQNVEASRDVIRAKMGARKPKIAIILGSGLGGLAAQITGAVAVPYKDLPGFPALTIEGHVGEVVVGSLDGVEVLAFKGRKHFYETDDAYPLKTMIRTVKALDIPILFVSNAAGSLRDSMLPGSLMMITDHINMMGLSPLVGPNDDDFGPRFPPMGNAWDPILRDKLMETAEVNKISLHEGVYAAVRGPAFETAAEIRMLQKMGGDAVGMSSAPDCIIARHCGLRVVGCSCITNMGQGLCDEQLSHAHTLENAARGAANFEKLVAAFVKRL